MGFDTQTKLVNLLLRENKISEDDLHVLEKEVEKNGKSIEEVLLKKNMVSSEDIAKAKSKIFSVPYKKLEDEDFSKNLLASIPIHVARNYKLIPLGEGAREFRVGLVDPGNIEAVKAIDYLAKERGKKSKIYVISQDDFSRILSGDHELLGEVESMLTEATGQELQKGERKSETFELSDVIKSAPVSEIVSTIIRYGVENRASDIHIEPLETESRVRYRIDGVLHTVLKLPSYIHQALISRIKVLANLKLDETRRPQDGRMRLTVDGKKIDFRVALLPLAREEKVALRILDTRVEIESLPGLGFSPMQVNVIRENIDRAHGFLLVTGPTGSGKTTTLYAMLKMLNNTERNIITLEDPIEYYIGGVNQSQINSEIGFSFAVGLRSVLRQDPNVIMVGEIRDNETAELAVHAALTGHLVLSTLHTRDVFGTIPRLIDMKIEPFLVASTLNLVLAQRLVRRICGACKKKIALNAEVIHWIETNLILLPPEIKKMYKLPPQAKDISIFRGEGCRSCGGGGYKGRILLAELFENDRTIREMIMNGFPLSEAKKYFLEKGYLTLLQDGFLKVVAGLTTVEEVLHVTEE